MDNLDTLCSPLFRVAPASTVTDKVGEIPIKLPPQFLRVLEEAKKLGVDQWRIEDHEDIYQLLTAVQKRSHYRGLKTSKLQMLRSLVLLQEDWEVGRVWVTRDRTGKARSILAGTALPYWWADQERGPMYATEMIFVSGHVGAGRKLLRMLELWAWTLPRVVKIEMDISSDIHPERTVKMYRNAGFSETGTIFVKNRPQMHKGHQE